MMKSILLLVSVAFVFAVNSSLAAQKPLFQRLGGAKAVTAVVNEFVKNVAADPAVNEKFQGAASDKERMAHFKKNLFDQICMATGGGCKYKGKDMKSAHVGMHITEPQFNAIVKDLEMALDHFKVPAKEHKELIDALATMKKDIVTM